MKCDEIFAALALLEKERGIPQDFMMEKIVQALITAYKRDHEDVENVVVDVNEEKRDLKMFVEKTVVEEVENPAAEISAEEAKAISAKYHVGDTVRFPVKNVDFGRIAAGNGKQVIIQGLREAEHGMIYDEYNSKQHEILTGTVVRVDPRTGNATVRLGTGADASDAVLLLGEQVSGEEDYEGICDAFHAFYSTYTYPYGTIGVTRCAGLEKLADIMRRINAAHAFDPGRLGDLQRLDGYTPTLFFDLEDYVRRLCSDDDALLAEFEKQLDATVPWHRHTEEYYSMANGVNPIRTFSGITTSDPSADPEAAIDRQQTAWWRATH